MQPDAGCHQPPGQLPWPLQQADVHPCQGTSALRACVLHTHDPGATLTLPDYQSGTLYF